MVPGRESVPPPACKIGAIGIIDKIPKFLYYFARHTSFPGQWPIFACWAGHEQTPLAPDLRFAKRRGRAVLAAIRVRSRCRRLSPGALSFESERAVPVIETSHRKGPCSGSLGATKSSDSSQASRSMKSEAAHTVCVAESHCVTHRWPISDSDFGCSAAKDRGKNNCSIFHPTPNAVKDFRTRNPMVWLSVYAEGVVLQSPVGQRSRGSGGAPPWATRSQFVGYAEGVKQEDSTARSILWNAFGVQVLWGILPRVHGDHGRPVVAVHPGLRNATASR
jgi:hypothetical protein